MLSQSFLVVFEVFVRSKKPVQKSKLRTIVPWIMAVMEIMVIVIGAEGQKLKQGPAEGVSWMSVITINNSKDHPYDCYSYMDWSI